MAACKVMDPRMREDDAIKMDPRLREDDAIKMDPRLREDDAIKMDPRMREDDGNAPSFLRRQESIPVFSPTAKSL